MNELHNNAPLGWSSSALLRRHYKRRTMRRLGYVLLLLSVIGWVMMLTSCASSPKQPCEPLPQVLMPATQSQPPKESYSLKAQALFKSWSEMLTNASVTSR